MKRVILLAALVLSVPALAKKKHIAFWHSLSGHLGETLTAIGRDFNKENKDYHIDLVYKGNYPETLTNFVAAFKAHLAPPLVQIFEIGTASMLYPKGVIKPVYQLMQKANNANFKSEQFLPEISHYYGDSQGRLLAMPFNSSSAVLYYNQSVLDKANIKMTPETWPQVEKIAKRLLALKLVNCGFSTTFPSWTQIESFSQWHGLGYASPKQGNNPLKVTLNYHAPLLRHHLKKLKQWQDEHVFEYGGRDSNAVSLFTSGKCAMLIQSSGAYMSLSQMVPFQLGVSNLPYWPTHHSREKRHNSALGGAAIWVVNGFDDETYAGVGAFLAYLSEPKVQARWEKETGYLPVTKKARAISLSHHSKAYKASNIALKQITNNPREKIGERLGNFAQIRLFNDEQIEAICSGNMSVEHALQSAEKHANFLLRRFEKNVN